MKDISVWTNGEKTPIRLLENARKSVFSQGKTKGCRMERTANHLTEAIGSLRKAIDTEFTGNTYYLAAQQVGELYELLNGKAKSSTVVNGTIPTFKVALDDVRKSAEAELFDNRFYLFAHKLDVLAFLASQNKKPLAAAETASRPEKAAASVVSSAPPSPEKTAAAYKNAYERNFEELAAASKARMQHTAAALGVTVPSTVPSQENAYDGELRRRSSDLGLEERTGPLASMEASTVSTEAVSSDESHKISPQERLPTSPLENGDARSSNSDLETKAASETRENHDAAAKNDHPPSSTVEKVEAKPPKRSFFAKLFG